MYGVYKRKSCAQCDARTGIIQYTREDGLDGHNLPLPVDSCDGTCRADLSERVKEAKKRVKDIGVPVGILVVKPELLMQMMKELRKKKWLLKGKNVSPFIESKLDNSRKCIDTEMLSTHREENEKEKEKEEEKEEEKEKEKEKEEKEEEEERRRVALQEEKGINDCGTHRDNTDDQGTDKGIGESKSGTELKAVHLSVEGVLGIQWICDALQQRCGSQNREEPMVEETLLHTPSQPQQQARVFMPGTNGLEYTLGLLKTKQARYIPQIRRHSTCCMGYVPTPIRYTRPEEQHVTGSSPKQSSHKPQVQAQPRFTFIELFAGIGGFHLGLRAIGGECVFASEIEEQARMSYKRYFGHAPAGDITQIEAENIPSFDILTAGFPCQSFSKAGSQTAMEHHKGTMFYEVVRILAYHKPKAFILENVTYILRMNEGETGKEILTMLMACGYNVYVKVMHTQYLVPQRRRRVFFVGIRSDYVETTQRDPTLRSNTRSFEWPDLSGFPLVSIRDILEPDPDPALVLTAQQWHNVCRSQFHLTLERGPEWRLADVDSTARTLMSMYKHSYHIYSEFVPVPLPPKRNGSADQVRIAPSKNPKRKRDVFEGRYDDSDTLMEEEEQQQEEDSDKGARMTVETTHSSDHATKGNTETVPENGQQKYGHDHDHHRDIPFPPPPRFFSRRECARLQGFPEDFPIDACRDKNRFYHQIGNAVCPPVVAAVGCQLLSSLSINTDVDPRQVAFELALSARPLSKQ